MEEVFDNGGDALGALGRHIDKVGRTHKLILVDVLADSTKRLFVVARRKRKVTVVLGEDGKTRDLLGAALILGGNIVDLIPRDLNIILGIALVVILERLIAHHHVAVAGKPHQAGCRRCQIDRAVLRLRHARLALQIKQSDRIQCTHRVRSVSMAQKPLPSNSRS